ncbi:MAG: VTT domain-containing protein [Planctomycetaceae bacterium]|nr:VTT domain-containing protein [Planctomycetaceae bacterium]
MKSAYRAALFLTVLFAIPIVPFVWLGESFEAGLLRALREPSSHGVVTGWVIGLLAADMFLPVPSSAVITYAGGVLGIFAGTMTAWVGLSLGAVGGFGLARLFGETIARRFSESEDIERMSRFTQRHGATALVLTRALPILAEACVLMLGAGRLSWRQFLLPMLASNLLLSLTYAACGAYFQDSHAFPVAIIASGAIPLIAALLIRRWWRMPS